MPLQPFPELDRTSPSFPTDVDAFFGEYMPQFVPDINALEANVDAKAAATISAVNTAMAAGLANAAANAAQTAADRVQTGLDRVATGQDRVQTGLDRTAVNNALASIASGPVASINGLGGIVTLKTIAGQALTGVGDIPLPAPSIVRSARTSNTQLVAADTTKLIDITSGTFTQTFAAAAALGNGWYAYLRNAGSGDITLDPNGAETIDGLASYVMYPGEARLVMCDGTALRSIVLNAFYRVFTTSGTFVRPPGYKTIDGMAWSGGASGSLWSGGAARGPGGGAAPFSFPAALVPATVTVTVGSGGASRTVQVAYDTINPGGNTSFGSLLTVLGASDINTGGYLQGAFGVPGYTPVSSGGSIYGGGLQAVNVIYGGASGGSANSSGSYDPPGVSVYGGQGGVASATGGTDGTAPGGGGAGARVTRSGAGARGELRVWGVI